MASSVACVAVPDASGAPSQASLSSLPGLQLLLRILPFRSHRQHQQHHVVKLPHVTTSTMEELHRHPLWRYGSTAAQWPEPRHTSNRPLAPAEAESALLAYVRLVSEAEQQQGGRSRQGRLCPADIAAELHALYSLAAIHAVQQQQDLEQRPGGRGHSSRQPLSDGDLVQLLKAYASLEDASQQHQQGSSSTGPPPAQHDDGQGWDSKAQAAAAAMGALYAFARLADATPQQQESVQQQQQQEGLSEQHQPGQLQVAGVEGSSTVQAYKSLARGSQGSTSIRSSVRNSSSSASGDLQVLSKLAQLGLQPAS